MEKTSVFLIYGLDGAEAYWIINGMGHQSILLDLKDWSYKSKRNKGTCI
jgi:hypothetical protein